MIDVLRGRILGSLYDFHRQLGGQINHRPTQLQAARVINAQSWTALFRAFTSHHPKVFPSHLPAKLDKP